MERMKQTPDRTQAEETDTGSDNNGAGALHKEQR